ncbi:MAG: thioredoxin domain-containing protein [Bacteroidia bacterium]
MLSGCTIRQVGSVGTSGDVEESPMLSEGSPYLERQAEHPVQWYPWGREAIGKATYQDKLLVISIGYASCHWCHVTDDQLFGDSSVAALMNRSFIPVKVDREERPDIDAICLETFHMISGEAGGWPLQAIALPDGRPVFAGTYYDPQAWVRVLQTHLRYYRESPEVLYKIADEIGAGMRQEDSVSMQLHERPFAKTDLEQIYRGILGEMDPRKGGRLGSPKFPMPVYSQFMAHYYYLSGDHQALRSMETHLQKMAYGGIYDQLGGGFSRYCTDEDWRRPHFEKMLYDNAQLASAYMRAYQLTRDPFYERIAYETLDFLDRELRGEQGGYYAALDSDSEGDEGRYYLWSRIDVEVALDSREASNLFCRAYNITQEGNRGDGYNILYRTFSDRELAYAYNLSEVQFYSLLQQSRDKLFEARRQRVLPARDRKQIVAWNALMLRTQIEAYRVFGDERFLMQAEALANFIADKCMYEDYSLARFWRDGKTFGDGFLEDYAYTAEAFVALYELTRQRYWLDRARQLSVYALSHFYNPQSGVFYYTSTLDPAPIQRRQLLPDGVMPAANAAMCRVLYLLGLHLDNPSFTVTARQMLLNMRGYMLREPIYYSYWAACAAEEVAPGYVLVLHGTGADALREAIDYYYFPDLHIASADYLKGKFADQRLSTSQNLLVLFRNGQLVGAYEHPRAVVERLQLDRFPRAYARN